MGRTEVNVFPASDLGACLSPQHWSRLQANCQSHNSPYTTVLAYISAISPTSQSGHDHDSAMASKDCDSSSVGQEGCMRIQWHSPPPVDPKIGGASKPGVQEIDTSNCTCAPHSLSKCWVVMETEAFPKPMLHLAVAVGHVKITEEDLICKIHLAVNFLGSLHSSIPNS
ncbi:hypothetical protein JZ751_017654 [Albula glossodonta]|uniref:Uncharacterized protein n=1 Tax=Albula glossodonta TaxID=121402 RepID=A0A8T2PNY8_9TELE|nr:hypothetical protein JZ751_017654 [Albula glossodonta]